MELIKIDPSNPSPEIIKRICLSLSLGRLVVLPTETVYTFAVDATSNEAIDKVYSIKGRAFNKPLHVVVTDIQMIKKYVKFNKKADKIVDQFIQGQLTLVLHQKRNRINAGS